ncbi:MAG: DUF4363 family protein [Ruminococcaceae bacterium]|nr:DUF4363 family protein [Oscillospiraceae bacterium]
MKTFISAIIIGVLLLGGSTISDMCIKNFSKEMIEENKNILENTSPDATMNSILQMEELLKERRMMLAGIINHISIDDIENCITEIKGYTKTGEYEEAKVRSYKLALLLERLPKEYGVSIQNIL